MFPSSTNDNKSCENLPILPRQSCVPLAKSLRLPAPSALLTPPLSPVSERRACSESLPIDYLVGTRLSDSAYGTLAAWPTLLPSPRWALDTREPVKRHPLQVLFTSPSLPPSPPEHEQNSYSRYTRINGCQAKGCTSPELLRNDLPCRHSAQENTPSRPSLHRFPHLSLPSSCIDGSNESPETLSGLNSPSPKIRPQDTSSSPVFPEAHDLRVRHGSGPAYFHDFQGHTKDCVIPDLSLPCTEAPSSSPGTLFEDPTPLVKASPAKQKFPFPGSLGPSSSLLKPLTTHRWPSAFLQLTPPSSPKKWTKGNSRNADRYIPRREFRSHARKSCLISTPARRLNSAERKVRKRSPAVDPFGSGPRVIARASGLRTRARNTQSTRNQPSAPRASRVQLELHDQGRAVSQGAIWGVGGSSATAGGITSTSDGRGGRITSCTNAPMYISAFLNETEPSSELDLHERRLAAAFEFDQAKTILRRSPETPSSPTSTASSTSLVSNTNSHTTWKDNEWKHHEPVNSMSVGV